MSRFEDKSNRDHQLAATQPEPTTRDLYWRSEPAPPSVQDLTLTLKKRTSSCWFLFIYFFPFLILPPWHWRMLTKQIPFTKWMLLVEQVCWLGVCISALFRFFLSSFLFYITPCYYFLRAGCCYTWKKWYQELCFSCKMRNRNTLLVGITRNVEIIPYLLNEKVERQLTNSKESKFRV